MGEIYRGLEVHMPEPGIVDSIYSSIIPNVELYLSN